MPWKDVTLNDGHSMPSIAFGTWRRGNGEVAVENVKAAIGAGFTHVDTAQAYRNEYEAGKALRAYPRDKVFVTTKYSGIPGLDIPTSLHNSLKNMGTSYVDLYLIHTPRAAGADIKSAWAQMEAAHAAGLCKSIGVSNFDERLLAELLEHAKVIPAVNQIMYHPYVLREQEPTIAFCARHNIVVTGWSPLMPLGYPYGTVSAVASSIAAREKAAPEQVLLAWSKAKGVVPVTSSTNRQRLESYIQAGELSLTQADLAEIDAAGAGPSSCFVSVSTLTEKQATTSADGQVSRLGGNAAPTDKALMLVECGLHPPAAVQMLGWRVRLGRVLSVMTCIVLGTLVGWQVLWFVFH